MLVFQYFYRFSQGSNLEAHMLVSQYFLYKFQARTSDTSVYYSCDDQFRQDKDSDNEQGVEEESSNINVVGNTNFNARQCFEGLFLHQFLHVVVAIVFFFK